MWLNVVLQNLGRLGRRLRCLFLELENFLNVILSVENFNSKVVWEECMSAGKSGRCTGLRSAWLFSHPSYRFMTVIHTVLYDSHVNIYVTRDVSFRYSSSNIFLPDWCKNILKPLENRFPFIVLVWWYVVREHRKWILMYCVSANHTNKILTY